MIGSLLVDLVCLFSYVYICGHSCTKVHTYVWWSEIDTGHLSTSLCDGLYMVGPGVALLEGAALLE